MERTRNEKRYEISVKSPEGNKATIPFKTETNIQHIFKPGLGYHDYEENLLDYEFDDESLIKHPREHNLYS